MSRPRDRRGAAIVALAAAIDLGLGAGAGAMIAVRVVGPLVGFLAAALTLSRTVAGTGLIDRVGVSLARAARGHAGALYVLVCLATALVTVVVSLDGAVVLMVPLVMALHRRHQAPLAPHLFAVVAVANTASIALPQGNPTNLVVISQLHLSAAAFTAHMLLPGASAAALAATILWVLGRRVLAAGYPVPRADGRPLSPEERRAIAALAAAAAAAWGAPFFGIQPWWPFIAVVAIAIAADRALRSRVAVTDRDDVAISGSIAIPWRIGVQIAGLVIVVEAIGVSPPAINQLSLPVLLAVALGTGAIAAAINNLPASVWAATLLSAGPVAYGATIGLGVGALAAPHGSVATLIAADLAGDQAPTMTARQLAPLAIAATIVATVLLRLTL